MLALSAQQFITVARQWPAELSLAEHMAGYTARHPLTEREIADVRNAMRITTMSLREPAIRTSYLMVHDQMERDFIPVVAERLRLPQQDLTVRLCAATVTGAFRVIDEDVGRRVIDDGERVSQEEALDLIDRAVREATNGRFGGPST